MKKISYFLLLILVFSTLQLSCQDNDLDRPVSDGSELINDNEDVNEDDNNEVTYLLPNIDLNHWKVTLPVGNPTEVEPPEILDYANNETLKPFFYNDSINGALVFYTYPGATTTNTSYSRTELREQMVPGSNNTNWTFAEGGNMKGTLSMDEVSVDDGGDYHRTIIMQIHGRLTNGQRDLIGASDNNAPPMLKIYWVNGYVRVKTKVLNDLNATFEETLHTDAWGNDEGYTFSEYVGFDKFTLEVKVTEGRMEVILNETASKVYDDVHIERWGIFENYFKAGNYLASLNSNAFARVKYYDLEISH